MTSDSLEALHPEDQSLWRTTERVVRVTTPTPTPDIPHINLEEAQDTFFYDILQVLVQVLEKNVKSTEVHSFNNRSSTLDASTLMSNLCINRQLNGHT